jgi:ABC-2 type transport system ATP-binding protein/lipopolysaccharide transport system ATP-binding protein
MLSSNPAPDPNGTSPAILLEDVSVHYDVSGGQGRSFKGFVIDTIKRRVEKQYVRALEKVSFQVESGEIFGIIGRNGAGKSTMLKVISRIIPPTEGRVRVWGRSVPLLGVGAGFEMELSGRDNIYLYSALLGRDEQRTREMLDSIVDFAEISDFVDQPMRTYSSGMKARLGFAVATAEIPEVLLIDEVLGVGDEMFRAKCQVRFEEFRRSGATIVIVSHAADQIQSACSRVAWLVNGRVHMLGEVNEVIRAYRDFYRAQRKMISIRQDR